MREEKDKDPILSSSFLRYKKKDDMKKMFIYIHMIYAIKSAFIEHTYIHMIYMIYMTYAMLAC